MPEKVDLWQRYHKSIPSGQRYPVITNVAISALGLVTWNTDIPASSQVGYGLTPYLGFLTAYDSTLNTSHSVQLSGLSPGVLYYLKVQSFANGFLTISDLYTFTYVPITGSLLEEDGVNYILLEDGTRIALEF